MIELQGVGDNTLFIVGGNMGIKKEKFGDRKDGIWVKEADPMHIFVPYLYPNRADSEAFINERIDLENVNRYLAEKNKDIDDDPYKLFHVILAAIVKTLTLRPKMNYFIKGYRTYKRPTVTIAFVVKKRFADDGKEALAFVDFDETTTIDTVKEKVYAEINECRSDKVDNSTAGMGFFAKMPRWMLRIAVWILHKLDFYGKVPEFLVKTDPNYASVMISNLGSIGLKAGYHHLSNWGTNSIFVVMGEKKVRPVYDEEGNMTMKETLDLGLTLDERLADGYYYSKSVKLLKHLLDNPQLLERPAGEEVDYDKK